jgi:hypothetical protein
LADNGGWKNWTLSTKLTVGVGLVLAAALVVVLNFA